MHAGCKLTPDHFKFAASAERTPVSRGDDFEGPGGSTCLWVSLSYIWAALFAATASTMAWVVVPVRSTMATWRGAIAGPKGVSISTAPRDQGRRRVARAVAHQCGCANVGVPPGAVRPRRAAVNAPIAPGADRQRESSCACGCRVTR